MEEAGGKAGSRYQTQCREKNIREETSKTSGRPKVNAEIQIAQQKSLSIALHSIRTFVQEWVFYQFGFVTLFFNHALLTEHCSERHLSLSSRKAKWCKHLAGHLAYSPDYKKSQQYHTKLLLHFKSGISDAGGWDSTKAGEIWTLRNKFPYFRTENLWMTGQFAHEAPSGKQAWKTSASGDFSCLGLRDRADRETKMIYFLWEKKGHSSRKLEESLWSLIQNHLQIILFLCLYYITFLFLCVW